MSQENHSQEEPNGKGGKEYNSISPRDPDNILVGKSEHGNRKGVDPEHEEDVFEDHEEQVKIDWQ